jgi:hypothetical protein
MRALSSIRGIALALAVLAMAAVAAYGYYWHSMAAKLRAGLEPWAAAQRARGYIVQWDQVELGGFPDAFRFRFTKASFGAERPLPVTLDAPSLVVAAVPWNLHHWQLAATEGARLAGPLGVVGADLGRLEASTGEGANGEIVLDIVASALDGIGLAQGTLISNATAHIGLPPHPPASHTDSALDAALQLTEVKLPASVPGFGDTLAELAISMQVKGSVPAGSFEDALTHWRDDGGTIELKEFRLRWGGLLVDTSGTLALDSDLQPEGALSAIITGQDAAVDLAVTAGTLQPQDAGIVKAVLGVLARPGPSGEKAITVPLTLQQSRLYLGPAALGRVPRISWE